MKLQQKIILISFAIVLALGALAGAAGGTGKATDFFMIVGMVGFFAGLLQLIVGLFLFVKTDKRYAQGFLMSAGLLILIGFATCTANFSMNMH
jgi:ABC-type lipopolysaccharide export system ATPase subunit